MFNVTWAVTSYEKSASLDQQTTFPDKRSFADYAVLSAFKELAHSTKANARDLTHIFLPCR